VYADAVPCAAPDTTTEWHKITGSAPPMWERIYAKVEPGTSREMLLVGNINRFKAGACWMLIVNGWIIRQSELNEGPESVTDCQRACDDFRDRIVAMWNT
jgi:hypothetical protein